MMLDHSQHVSGAEHSMLTLLDALPSDVDKALVCPPGGALAEQARSRGLDLLPMRALEGSLKLSPTATPKALMEMAGATRQTGRHIRRWRADVLHANTIRGGLVATPAARFAGVPSVVHLRDVLPAGGASDASLRLIAAAATEVIAISEFVADRYRRSVEGAEVTVIANPVDLRRFHPEAVDRVEARRAFDLPRFALTVGVLGQITPWKGQLEAVKALARLRDSHPELRLLIAGEAKFVAKTTRYDNASYLAEIEQLIESERLGDRVTLLGERSDVPTFLRALDMLVVPSRDEPFGRVVIEGMAMGLPVVASAEGGPAEIIDDEVDGVLVEPGDPGALAAAIERLCTDVQRRREIGRRAQQRSHQFAAPEHAERVRAVYERALAAPPRTKRIDPRQ